VSTVFNLSFHRSRTVVIGFKPGFQSFCPALNIFRMTHSKCINNPYQYRDGGKTVEVEKCKVSEDQISWDTRFPDYAPPDFTAPSVLTAAWADSELDAVGFCPVWNSVDGSVNRASHEGRYIIERGGRPINPNGRTGIRGRGLLGKWGPNHAADPIVTRWKRDGEGRIVTNETDGKKVLEFVSIQRKDTGAWAIPGGMVDPGEKVSVTVKREFLEEALDSTDTGKDNVEELETMVEDFFNSGTEVYRGYVDDPRNTDNSWMETVAFNFHDSTGEEVGRFPLKAGDDATAIQWMEIDSSLNLYASHKQFVQIVVGNLDAHW